MGRKKQFEDSVREEVAGYLTKFEGSETTKNRIANGTANYIWWRNLSGENVSPPEILEEARNDLNTAEEKLKNYYRWLMGEHINGYAVNPNKVLKTTAHERVFSKVASFFSHNDYYRVRFSPAFTPSTDEISWAIQEDAKHPFTVETEDGEGTTFDKAELRRFFNALSPRDRAVGLALVSSSHDSIDVLSLTVNDFLNGIIKNGESRFYWTGNRAKTHKPFQSFMSAEATQAIFDYLKSERPDAKPEEPLFTNKLGTMLDPDTLSDNFKNTAKAIGITWNPKCQSPYRPKRLRSIFETACDITKVPTNFAKILMGHKRNVHEKYNQNIPELLLVYKRIEPLVSIMTGSERLQTLNNENLSLKYSKEKTDRQVSEMNEKLLALEREKLELQSLVVKQRVALDEMTEQNAKVDQLMQWKQEMEVRMDVRIVGNTKLTPEEYEVYQTLPQSPESVKMAKDIVEQRHIEK
jgi:hypothetical protein